MEGPVAGCLLCDPERSDRTLVRVPVWEDDRWRLTVSTCAEVLGFSLLEPKRHIPTVADLDGEEAATFGSVLARCYRVLKEVTGAEVVWVLIYGGHVPHLHVHLAPHREGDALSDQFVKGTITERQLPDGPVMFFSDEYPPLPEEQLRAVADRVRECMASGS